MDLNIPKADCPLIVFSDNTSGFVEWMIKWRTKASWNHVMWLPWPGEFASQGNTYSLSPFTRYIKKNNRLKFFSIPSLTPVQKALLIESITKKLAKPWWKKRYDWLGIFGQAIGMPWINTTGLEYCSEDVGTHLKYVAEKGMNSENLLKHVIHEIPKHISPQELEDYFKKYPEHFKVYLKWDGDDEQNTSGFTLAFI